MKPYLDKYTRRMANETIVSHDSMSGVARVFRRAQSLIPMLNFSISGPWQVDESLCFRHSRVEMFAV